MKDDVVKQNFVHGLALFQKRNGLSVKDIVEITGSSRSNYQSFSKGLTTPSFEKVANLLEAGMTLEEAFGKELADKIVANEGLTKKRSDNTLDDFLGAVKEVLERKAREKDEQR